MFIALAATGCGGASEDAFTPAGVGPVAGAEEEAWATLDAEVPPAAGSLAGDLVSGVTDETGGADGAGEAGAETLAAELPTATATTGETKVFYLRYADGTPLPRTAVDPCRGTAPKFVCDFAPTLEECQRQIQTYLDRWYADFNIVFTLTRPTSGKFYTEVVSSGGGAWCDADAKVAGLAPFLCKDLEGGVAYTFLGGKTAFETAIIIAQEQAHLLGLQHTSSQRDLMNPTICTDCQGGFEDRDNHIADDRCGQSAQNSYATMRQRLGVWTGGVKPTPFGCKADQSAPSVAITEPATGAAVARSFRVRAQASDDCEVSHVRVTVAPMGLAAESMTPPFEWTLANISGRQTITVTATDLAGKSTSTSVVVNAPGATTQPGGSGGQGGGGGGGTAAGAADGDAAAGCQLAGCDVTGGARGGGVGAGSALSLSSAAALLLAAVLLSARRRRAPAPVRSRCRRRVSRR